MVYFPATRAYGTAGPGWLEQCGEHGEHCAHRRRRAQSAPGLTGGVMRKGWLPSKTSLLAVVLLLCGVIGLLSPASAGATTITAFPVDFSAAEGAAFNGAVATFEDDNPAATPADFTATIDWGDGSGTTAGTIFASSAAFTVIGQH